MNQAKPQRKPREWSAATKISVIYAVVAFLWLSASDKLAALLASDPQQLAKLQAYKGWLFIIATAWLLYALIRNVTTTARAKQLAEANAEHEADSQKRAVVAASPWSGIRTPILIFCLLAGVIGSTGYLVYRYQEAALESDIQQELMAMTNAKVDRPEIHAPIERLMLLMAALFGIFIAGAGFGIVLWWRQQHANFLIARYQDELKHRVLVQHFDTLAQHANDIVLLMDEAGRLREVNDKAVSSYGYSREEFLALNVKDLRALETQAILPRQMQEVADRDGLVFETIHVRKNGSRFPAEVSARVIKVGGKRFIQSIVRDITQRKHIEADLREREAQYRSLFENLREAIISLDMNGQVQLANPAAAMMLNYESPHAMLGLSAADVFLKRAQAKAVCGELLAKGYVENFETTLLKRDGKSRIHILGSATLQRNKHHFQHIETIFTNVTERKEAEEKVRTERDRAQQYLDVAGVMIVVLDREGNVVQINRKGCEILGYKEAEIVGNRWFNAVFPEYHREEIYSAFQKLIAGEIETVEYVENVVVCRGGEQRMIAWHNAVIRDKDGQVQFTLGSGEDITERKQAEQALRASEARLTHAQRIAHLGSWEIDLKNHKTYWSEEMFRIMGFNSQAVAPSREIFLSRVHPDDCERVERAIAQALTSKAPYDIEYRIVRPTGEERLLRSQDTVFFDDQGQPTVMTGVVQDITKRRCAEAQIRQQELQLIQADKMAALGTLVSGIAHEINNPNNLILINAQLLADAWTDVRKIIEEYDWQLEDQLIAGLPAAEMCTNLPMLINDVYEGALRIQKIVANLKDFVRPGENALCAELDLNEVIRRALDLLSHSIKKRMANLQLDLTADLPPILGDFQQIEQVVVNLLINALEALPEEKSCRITVATHLNQAEDCVELEIKDEGIGISKEHLSRIFEPFFTTKQQQGGTGLGLFITYKLVNAHHGTLVLESEPEKGTVARVKLPIKRLV